VEVAIMAPSITELKNEDSENVGKKVQQVIDAGAGVKRIECTQQENGKWTIRAVANGNN
jgi:hypothetical protein